MKITLDFDLFNFAKSQSFRAVVQVVLLDCHPPWVNLGW